MSALLRFSSSETSSGHSTICPSALDVRANCRDQIANLPQAAFWRAEVESHLIEERGHCGQCIAGSAPLVELQVGGSHVGVENQKPHFSQRTREMGHPGRVFY